MRTKAIRTELADTLVVYLDSFSINWDELRNPQAQFDQQRVVAITSGWVPLRVVAFLLQGVLRKSDFSLPKSSNQLTRHASISRGCNGLFAPHKQSCYAPDIN